MQVLPRRLGMLLAGAAAAIALAVPMAGQADAASTTVRLHTQANTGESMAPFSLFAFMQKTDVTTSNQKWIKTDKVFGFAEYRSAFSPSLCLSRPPLTGGGSLIGKLIRMDPCDGSVSQQWKLGVSGEFQHRGSGLIAEVDLNDSAHAPKMTQLVSPPLEPNQIWHVHPA
jgi:hypothetical protein